MTRLSILLFLILFSLSFVSIANQQVSKPPLALSDTLTLVSYNVENLFDTINNALTDDDAFTPEGEMRWTRQRYYTKLKHLARTISRIGGRQWPSLICLVEVENAGVIKDLLHYSALGRKADYKFAITHSPDPRGVDLAILYRPQQLELLASEEHIVHFTSDLERKTRNILELTFALRNGDKLHIMGVHLPSRRGGSEATEPLRCQVAHLMRQRCDSLYQELSVEQRGREHFILMGDFNEEDHETAIRDELMAHLSLDKEEEEALSQDLKLYSMMNPYIERSKRPKQPYGSYCFQRVWTQLDHFILSESLFKSNSRVRYRPGSAQNYYAPFLTSRHKVAGFSTPQRTYVGTHYLGGYSDHYPIRLSLSLREE